MKNVKELLAHLKVEQIDSQTFAGGSKNIGNQSIYGGQVLAQSLNAAYKTVSEDRLAHSIHAYFFLPGDFAQKVTYKVETIRDGRSFTTRNVKAFQNENVIFESTISFQKEEESVVGHQFKKPTVFRTPNFLFSYKQFYEKFKNRIPKSISKFLSIERPIETKPVEVERFFWNKKWPAKKNNWIRFKGASEIKLSYVELQQILLYASDFNLLVTALDPYPKLNFGNTKMASIDHAMWFHSSFNPKESLLYHLESPSASNSRAFARGSFYTRKGKLVASVAQEGLVRKSRKK